jgi:hypothetical protein
MLSNHISDLVTAADEFAKQPGVDKRAARRISSSLLEALYAAKYCEMSIDPTLTQKRQEDGSTQATDACICARGMRKSNCRATNHV